jgi:hypothetical protein
MGRIGLPEIEVLVVLGLVLSVIYKWIRTGSLRLARPRLDSPVKRTALVAIALMVAWFGYQFTRTLTPGPAHASRQPATFSTQP